MTSTTLSESRAWPKPKDRTLAGALAMLLGLGFIFLVGFAPVSAVHNAAHDTRHSAAFPCH
jgi:cobalt transporter subunit CbtB